MRANIGIDAGESGPPPLWARAVVMRDGLLPLAFAFGALTAIFDKMTQVPREMVLFWALPVLALLDLGDRRALRRRAILVAVVFVATTICGWIVCRFAEHKRILPGETLRQYFSSGVWAQWLAAIWFYSPLGLELAERRGRRAPAPLPAGRSGFEHAQAAIFLAFGFWSLITCFSSTAPPRSFLYYSSEAGLYAPFFLLWLRAAGENEGLQASAKRLGFVALVLGTLMGAAVGSTYLLGGENLRRALGSFSFFGDTPVELEAPNSAVWRLMFPFGHHNRMAYFSLLCVLLAPFGLMGARRPSRKRITLVGVLIAAALANLEWTLNRGAMLALGAALAVQIALLFRRRAAAAALIAAGLGALILSPVRDRMATLLEPATYNEADSTVALRFQHWRVALEMIDRHHSLGIGYGWKHVEKNYWDIAQRRGWPVNEKVHAHNVWLEIGAESGIPAVVLFVVWQFSRVAWLGSLWRRRARLDAEAARALLLWIGVETAIFVYSLGNLPTRRSLGLLTFGVWSLMVVDLIRIQSGLRNRQYAEATKSGSPETGAPELAVP